MATDLSGMAHRLSIRVNNRSQRWEDLRDWIDAETGGDLDCVPLDILTDMVKDRLTPNTGQHPRPADRKKAPATRLEPLIADSPLVERG